MSFPAFAAFRADAAAWLPSVTDLARSHGFTGAVVPFRAGTNLIAAVGSHTVIKVFPPMLRHQFLSETMALTRLHGTLHVPTPTLLAQGEHAGWPYLLMTRLAGESGERVWPTLDEAGKVSVLHQVGGLMAAVQGVPADNLLSLEPAWEPFLAAQQAGCLARHTRLGLPQRYLDGVDAYLRDAPHLLPNRPPPVILTGEYIAENILLDGSRVCGLIDFGDVMTGWGDYDLLGPSTFLCEGRRDRVRALWTGFGYTAVDATMTRRWMTLLLLHRFSDLVEQVRIPGWQHTESLEALERLIWPL